ncbi:TIGR00730 family Rossman fold protein [Microbacterium sp. H1-D42]|uniref:LOG family protein n=1 Tax=Microbacterium sp. H1-D42 TaxID=2925844 RepID=UPI001F5350CC|nr:TIGR00730 family Rossman fold protein [Microbacterium sp. H1-D42]UNK69581.1 TIGR00730 family Rossman fold protein [Microbacterium sp. H1-D42]
MTDDARPDDLAADIATILDDAGIVSNRTLVERMLQSSIRLGQEDTDRLDLKIASAALAEMGDAFRLFRPYAQIPKVTVFGSARTQEDDPLYGQAGDVSAALAADGWMVVTGAGPGIMRAAAQAAGSAMAIGVSIRLPFEEKPSDVIAQGTHLVQMKYFFTRKLMLIKESLGFICLPGGFGTMDEMFELLTLQQTGKAEPVPIVLLDEPGGTFWRGLERFVDENLAAGGFISTGDLDRVLITDSVDAAVAEITGFWHNYDSLRWVGDRLVLRLRNAPTDAEIAELNEQFGDLLLRGAIERTEPLSPERADDDRLELPRVSLALNQFKVGALHRLIRAINTLPSAR